MPFNIVVFVIVLFDLNVVVFVVGSMASLLFNIRLLLIHIHVGNVLNYKFYSN